MALVADYIQLQQALVLEVVVEVRHHSLVDQLNVVRSGVSALKYSPCDNRCLSPVLE